MKRLALLALAVLCLGLTSACGKKEEPAPAKKPLTEEKVMKEAKEALQTALAYTEQQKEEYQKKINAQLDEMQKKMAELKAQAEQAKPEAQAKLKEQMDALKTKMDAAQKKIDELKVASGKAWEDLKQGMDKALADLKESYKKAAGNSK